MTSAGNFLTKERYLGTKARRVFLACVVCFTVFGCFYPSIIGFFQWSLHHESSFQGRVIHLPILWTEDESGTGSWERSRPHAFTQFGDFLKLRPTPKLLADEQGFALWGRIYGQSSTDDLNRFSELRTLVDEGMFCGSIKYGQLEGKPDGQMAVGCLTKDHQTMFDFSGTESGFKSALSIIEQAK